MIIKVIIMHDKPTIISIFMTIAILSEYDETDAGRVGVAKPICM